MMATVVGVLGLVALFLGAGWYYYAADIKDYSVGLKRPLDWPPPAKARFKWKLSFEEAREVAGALLFFAAFVPVVVALALLLKYSFGVSQWTGIITASGLMAASLGYAILEDSRLPKEPPREPRGFFCARSG